MLLRASNVSCGYTQTLCARGSVGPDDGVKQQQQASGDDDVDDTIMADVLSERPRVPGRRRRCIAWLLLTGVAAWDYTPGQMAKARRSRQIAASDSHDRGLPNGVGVPGTMLLRGIAAITARYSTTITRLAAPSVRSI